MIFVTALHFHWLTTTGLVAIQHVGHFAHHCRHWR